MRLPAPEEWPVEYPLADVPDDLLAARAAETPEALALLDTDRDERWTYAALDQAVGARARRLATELDGGRVGLLVSTGIDVAVSYFAAARLGASTVPLNLRLDDERLRTQAARADVGVLVCEPETAPRAEDIAPADATIHEVEAADRDEVEAADRDEVEAADRDEVEADDGFHIDSADHGGDEPAVGESSTPDRSADERLVMFTSGTTGEPKGVRLTRTNLVASAVGSAARLGVDPADRWLAPLPTYHMGGLAPLIRSTLYGTTTVFQRSFDAEATAALVYRRNVTALSLVPTMLVRLLDAGWNPPEQLRFVLLGGAPATPDLVDRALDRGVPVCPTYGLTETASQVATATPEEARDHRDTVGHPISTARVTVRDGEPCDPGETGELVVDGPIVTPGYLDPDRTAAAFDERGLRTGDLGYRDEDGRLWVVGRTDDRIVTGGENVHPARVVDAIRDLDGVEDAAVVGLPDEEWGERVAALVVGGLPADEIRRELRAVLADYEVPKTIAIADGLPRTASGTVDRDAVRDRLESVREDRT